MSKGEEETQAGAGKEGADGDDKDVSSEESCCVRPPSPPVKIHNRDSRLNEKLRHVTQQLVKDLERASRTSIKSLRVLYICIDEDPSVLTAASSTSSIWFERVISVEFALHGLTGALLPSAEASASSESTVASNHSPHRQHSRSHSLSSLPSAAAGKLKSSIPVCGCRGDFCDYDSDAEEDIITREKGEEDKDNEGTPTISNKHEHIISNQDETRRIPSEHIQLKSILAARIEGRQTNHVSDNCRCVSYIVCYRSSLS